ncbi:hypothetical protein FOZ62_012979 [Perkinsus olseni]|uniref:Uncharacterized protein n=1 Tax=Perkinsus olseni TaxID=32597 RepID=A0A7J6S8S3_PEROL|nr:hypothetical protein FOZ62_012979 [Perkinsus olseni]
MDPEKDPALFLSMPTYLSVELEEDAFAVDSHSTVYGFDDERLGEASPTRRAVQRSATDSHIRLSWVSPIYQEAQSLEGTPDESEVEEAGLLHEGEGGAAVVLAGEQSVATAPSSDLESTTAPMAAPGLDQDCECGS